MATKKVAAEITVITVGEENKFNHLDQKTLKADQKSAPQKIEKIIVLKIKVL